MEETGFLIRKYLFTDLDNSPSHNEKSEIIIWSRKQIKKYVFSFILNLLGVGSLRVYREGCN